MGRRDVSSEIIFDGSPDIVRKWLPRVTAARYIDAKIDPAMLTVQVQDVQGNWRNAEILSQGTREQIYLLLRVAVTDLPYIATRADLPQRFRTTNYVRDWLPIRREQCAKRVSRKNRWSRFLSFAFITSNIIGC